MLVENLSTNKSEGRGIDYDDDYIHGYLARLGRWVDRFVGYVNGNA